MRVILLLMSVIAVTLARRASWYDWRATVIWSSVGCVVGGEGYGMGGVDWEYRKRAYIEFVSAAADSIAALPPWPMFGVLNELMTRPFFSIAVKDKVNVHLVGRVS